MTRPPICPPPTRPLRKRVSPAPLLGLLLALPAVAGAQEGGCPTGTADLVAGVRVAWDDGSVSTLTRDSAGLTTEVTDFAEEGLADEHVTALHGYLTIKIGTPSAMTGGLTDVSRFDYTPEVMAAGPLAPGQTRQIEVVVTGAGGGFRERQTLEAGTPQPLRIGDCTFDSYPVRVVLTDLVPSETDVFDYVPALDTAFFRGALDDRGQPLFTVTPLSIHRLD